MASLCSGSGNTGLPCPARPIQNIDDQVRVHSHSDLVALWRALNPPCGIGERDLEAFAARSRRLAAVR